MGCSPILVGQEAQGVHVRSGVSDQPGLHHLVAEPVAIPASRAEGFRGLLQHARQTGKSMKDPARSPNIPSQSGSSIVLLEIYAEANSTLTQVCQNNGVTAIRLTREDGDPSTITGRKILWQRIKCLQPEHIWAARF